mmetsp:Transcript_69495/g.225903  ORF Transcript_69495/g.225903 Transcript_69495/m.225903 type:complete len:187 (-) Transcript_69495:56-616(-)
MSNSEDRELQDWERSPSRRNRRTTDTTSLTARPRGQAPKPTENRPTPGGGGGGSSNSGAMSARGSAGRAAQPAAVNMPLSARGEGSGGAAAASAAAGEGSFQVNCGPNRNARQIVQEVTRALTAHGVSFRQTSSFSLRCQERGVRLRADVVQAERGSSFVVRMTRVAGDVWHYRDLCARLVADMCL